MSFPGLLTLLLSFFTTAYTKVTAPAPRMADYWGAPKYLAFALVYWEANLAHGVGRHPGHGKSPRPTAACEQIDSVWCGYSQHSLDAMRITAAFNQADGVHLLTPIWRLQNNTFLSQQLARANVHVVDRDQFRQPGSRAERYFSLHVGNGQKHPAEMEGRFCELADLAKAQRWDGILTLDSDEVLFSNANDLLRGFTEDVLAPCDECSQVVRWRTSALDRFCDALLEYWTHTPQERKRVNAFAEKNSEVYFNDMQFLAIFVKSGRYGHITRRTNATLLSHHNYGSEWRAGQALPIAFGNDICGARDTVEKYRRAMTVHHASIHYERSSNFSVPRPYAVQTGEPLAILHFIVPPEPLPRPRCETVPRFATPSLLRAFAIGSSSPSVVV